MAAKKRAADSASAGSALRHNPFGALGGIRSRAGPNAVRDAGAGDERSGPAGAAEAEAEAVAKAAAAAGEPFGLEHKLVIRRELKGRGGKTVTRIAGLPSGQRDAVASMMKRKLGCGAVVEGDDLLLLGDLMDRAAEWLRERGATRIVKGN